MSKKYIVLPVILVTGVVSAAVFTTETSAVLQSVKNNATAVALDNQRVSEQLQAKTSLTYLSDKIALFDFVKSNTVYVGALNASLASR